MKVICAISNLYLLNKSAVVYRKLRIDVCRYDWPGIRPDHMGWGLSIGYVVIFLDNGQRTTDDLDFHADTFQAAYDMANAWVNPELAE